MSPTLLAAVTDCAMDDAFWASRPGLEKRAADAGAAPQFDDGTIDIGGVKIPRKVLYGLAMGGLAGGAGGVAGGMDLKTIALLAALGASVGGAGGYGLEKLDEHTPVEPGGTTSRADARRLEAEAKSRAAVDAQQSGGVATQAIRAIKGDPSNDLLEIGGTLAQGGAGGLLGSKLHAKFRAGKLNKAIAGNPDYDINRNNAEIDKVLGVAGKPGKDGAISPLAAERYDDLRKEHARITAERTAAFTAPDKPGITGRIRGMLRRVSPRYYGIQPRAADFAGMSGIADGRTRKALAQNFSRMPSMRRLPGAVGGAVTMLLPSLSAFTGKPGDNNGALPLASLINHWRQPK